MSKIGDIFGPEGWIGSIYSDDSSPWAGCLGTLIVIGIIVFGFIWLVAHFPPFALLILLWPEILLVVLVMTVREGESFWEKPPACYSGMEWNKRYSVAGKVAFFATIIAFQLAGISLVLKFGWEIYGSKFTAMTVLSFLFSIVGIPVSFLVSGISTIIEEIFINK